jgi:uncharacterized protein
MKKVLNNFSLTIVLVTFFSFNINHAFAQKKEPVIKGKAKPDTTASAPEAPAILKGLTIITGTEKGSYQQMGLDIKSIYRNPDSVVLLLSTGSLSNFNRLTRDTFVDLAFIQYDLLLHQELLDMQKKRNRKTEKIRVVLPLGVEEIHLVTTKDSKINSLKDLKEKKVAIGVNTSGTYYTATLIKEKVKGEWFPIEKGLDDAITALVRKEIDAFFFVGAAPVNKLVTTSTNYQNFKLIPLTEKELADYYTPSTISKTTYKWMTDDVQTYGVRLVMVTDISHLYTNDVFHVDNMLEDVKSKIDQLQKTGHPKWKTVDFKFDGINWKIYDGSKRIFNITTPE